MMTTSELDQLCVNTIRALAMDAVQKANSGHPGLPLGAAPMAYVLWTRFLRHNPAHPQWADRDRFILSGGHGSMLLYALLHLTGYALSLDDLENFRQWDSPTPGHPEHGLAAGVEATTGPLGQGFAMGVGMAIAEAYLAARYNRPGHEIVNHHTYAIVTDGDLMEGVASEAASLAGHLKLGKLIYLYDDNKISLAGATHLTFTEDVGTRFEAYDWHVQRVEDGNDRAAIQAALENAQRETERPSLIIVRTHIGFGSPHKQDTFEAHGSPLGADEVKLTKKNLGFPEEPAFFIPGAALEHFRAALEKGSALENEWNTKLEAYATAHPELANEFQMLLRGELPQGWDADIPTFQADAKGVSTRVAGGQVLNAIAKHAPNLIGGSADLNPSTMTALKGMGDFEPAASASGDHQGAVGGGWNFAGRNVHYGVREHAMGAAANGMALHGGIIPFTATFFTFSDYMRPSIRLAALMEQHVIFVFSHDSIALGEDGPTHQPVEQLAALRAIPHLSVIRPCDANETAEAWRVAMQSTHKPVALVLTRQNVPTLDRMHLASAEGLRRGAYILADAPGGDPSTALRTEPDIILIASGSEVSLILGAQQELAQENIRARVVSMPSWDLFDAQSQEYRDSVLPPHVRARLAVEAGVAQGWHKYVGDAGAVLSIERFGASAPYQVLFEKFGYTAKNVAAHARRVCGEWGMANGIRRLKKGEIASD
ncbi:MAG: transketolase [Chloroflexi bacterium]|nr:transketolase [Chloroflexota bacterium]